MKDLELYALLDKIIENRVKMGNGCWRYNLFVNPGGYGRTNFKGKKILVHRFIAYVVLGLDLKSKLKALHKCDTPDCFNPLHLLVGTQRDNILDCIAKGRANYKTKIKCKNGHDFTIENSYFSGNRRHCKQCKLISVKKYQESLKIN